MAPWSDAKLFFCIFIITCSCAVTSAQMLVDCCNDVKPNEIKKPLVADYSHQIAGQGCSINATILITRKGRKLCVSPDQSWVKEITKHVDELKKACKAHKYKLRRCTGMKPE